MSQLSNNNFIYVLVAHVLLLNSCILFSGVLTILDQDGQD